MSEALAADVAADEIADVLQADVRVMVEHALSTGHQVNATWLEVARQADRRPLTPDQVRRLARCHDALSLVVAPATPRSLLYVRSRGHLRLVRWLVAFGVVMLAGFVALATDPDVGSNAADFEEGSGHELFVNMLFQLCAAGLGATFAALFAISGKARAHNVDDRDEVATTVRIMLGLVSGMVLAQLAPVDTGEREFGRPLLALLGGFSVDVVYQTLKRLVEVASSLVAPVPDGASSERERALAREEQLKASMAQRLVRLRSSMTGDAVAEVDALVAELAPTDVTPDEEAPTAPARRRGRA